MQILLATFTTRESYYELKIGKLVMSKGSKRKAAELGSQIRPSRQQPCRLRYKYRCHYAGCATMVLKRQTLLA